MDGTGGGVVCEAYSCHGDKMIVFHRHKQFVFPNFEITISIAVYIMCMNTCANHHTMMYRIYLLVCLLSSSLLFLITCVQSGSMETKYIWPSLVTVFGLVWSLYNCMLMAKGDMSGLIWSVVSSHLDFVDGTLARYLDACSEFGNFLDK